MKDELFMKVGKGKTIEEFVQCFESLKGKQVKINDREEILITGTVDENYDLVQNKNYRLLKAVPLMSTDGITPQESYIGKFETIQSVYVVQFN